MKGVWDEPETYFYLGEKPDGYSDMILSEFSAASSPGPRKVNHKKQAQRIAAKKRARKARRKA